MPPRNEGQFLSLDQLKSRTWPTRDAALKELKANAFAARGADYELREHRPGSWQILPLTEVPSDDPKPEPPINTGRKKPAMARIKAAPVALFPDPDKPEPDPPSNVTHLPARAARGAKMPAGQTVARKAPDPKQAADATPITDQPTEAVAPPPPHPGTDLSPLPSKDGPFTLRVEAATLIQTAVVTNAHDISRRIKRPVTIIDGSGAVVRLIDAASVKAVRRASRKQRAAGTTRGERAPRGVLSGAPEGVFAEHCRLAIRPTGVLRSELTQLNGGKPRNWKRILERVGGRYGYAIAVDSTGDTPRYMLTKPN